MRRWTEMDGICHVEGDCCQDRRCRRCRKPEHLQGTAMGAALTCEGCEDHAGYWNSSMPPVPAGHSLPPEYT